MPSSYSGGGGGSVGGGSTVNQAIIENIAAVEGQGQYTLNGVPSTPSEVVVEVENEATLIYGDAYTISSNVLTLSAEVVAGLVTGSTIRVIYYVTDISGVNEDIESLTNAVATDVTDFSDWHFLVRNAEDSPAVSRDMVGTELAKALDVVLKKDTVAEMLALTGVPDGTRVDTARYSTSHAVGDGSGGTYVYDADSTATIDGGFVMPGIGGSLSFSGTTFNGTAGTGRWLLKDMAVANVMQFGAVLSPSNATDAIRRAVNAVDGGGLVSYPPNATFRHSMIFVSSGDLRIKGSNTVIEQLHDATYSTEIGSGQYKISSAFLIRQGADNVDISGFRFTTAGAFPTVASGFEGYFPSIAASKMENLTITKCEFSGLRRGVFTQGVRNLYIANNVFDGTGMLDHVGYVSNQYFHDASTDTSTIFSSRGTTVRNNLFRNYDVSALPGLIFFSGVIDGTIEKNVITVDSGTTYCIYVFANDYGPHYNGTSLSTMAVSVKDNSIRGTCSAGIFINGHRDSVISNAVWDDGDGIQAMIDGNTLDVVGVGYKFADCDVFLKSKELHSSTSPIQFSRSVTGVISGSFVAEGTGVSEETLHTEANFTSTGIVFRDFRLENTNDSHLINCDNAVITFDSAKLDWKSEIASNRMIIMGGASSLAMKDVDASVTTDIASVFMVSSALVDCTIERSKLRCFGAGASTFRAISLSSGETFRFLNSVAEGAVLLEDVTTAIVENSNISSASSSTNIALDVICSGLSQKATFKVRGNVVNQPAENVIAIRCVSNNDASNNSTSFVNSNLVNGNSSASLIQQTVHGTLYASQNRIINAGSGGSAATVTGSAVLNP